MHDHIHAAMMRLISVIQTPNSAPSSVDQDRRLPVSS